MKKLVFSAISLTLIFNTLTIAKEYEGDKKLACEAILCLSSGKRPEECNPSISKFFSIKPKNPKDLIKERRKFLDLCPTDNNVGDMDNVKGKISKIEDCSADYLNTKIQHKKFDSWYFRINPNLPKTCNNLEPKPVYICSKEWYLEDVWKKRI